MKIFLINCRTWENVARKSGFVYRPLVYSDFLACPVLTTTIASGYGALSGLAVEDLPLSMIPQAGLVLANAAGTTIGYAFGSELGISQASISTTQLQVRFSGNALFAASSSSGLLQPAGAIYLVKETPVIDIFAA